MDEQPQGQARGRSGVASDVLLPIVYDELRRLARAHIAHERPGQTLQPTALVHEAYLRLTASKTVTWENRAHFFGAAAEAMRQILIDRARRRDAARHGGGRDRVALTEDHGGPGVETGPDIMALDAALGRLAAESPEKAQLVKLRYFAGLTLEQAAEALGVSRATADRWWGYARAWLYHELAPGEKKG